MRTSILIIFTFLIPIDAFANSTELDVGIAKNSVNIGVVDNEGMDRYSDYENLDGLPDVQIRLFKNEYQAVGKAGDFFELRVGYFLNSDLGQVKVDGESTENYTEPYGPRIPLTSSKKLSQSTIDYTKQ